MRAYCHHRVSVCVSVRLCVCLCVTHRYCIKTAKRRITPTPFQKPQFWPLSAHSASTVRAGEKVQLALIGSRSTARFPTSHRWTVYVTFKSHKGWFKTRFCCFCQQNSTYVENRLLQSFLVWIFTSDVAFHFFVAGNRRHFNFNYVGWT